MQAHPGHEQPAADDRVPPAGDATGVVLDELGDGFDAKVEGVEDLPDLAQGQADAQGIDELGPVFDDREEEAHHKEPAQLPDLGEPVGAIG